MSIFVSIVLCVFLYVVCEESSISVDDHYFCFSHHVFTTESSDCGALARHVAKGNNC